MKIKKLKKIIIILSVLLIIAGASISAIGFGVAGFDFENLKDNNNDKWYQTVHISETESWYGVQFGDLHLISIVSSN